MYFKYMYLCTGRDICWFVRGLDCRPDGWVINIQMKRIILLRVQTNRRHLENILLGHEINS